MVTATRAGQACGPNPGARYSVSPCSAPPSPTLSTFGFLPGAGATNLLLVTFLVPVNALLLAIALLGEMLEIRQVSGMVLIGLGLVAVDGRPMAAVKRRVITMAGYNTWAGVFQ